MIKEKIGNLFGNWKLKEDSFEQDGKGVWQRFNELLSEDLDALVSLIDDLIANLYKYDTVKSEYIAFVFDSFGNYLNWDLYSEAQKRSMLSVLTHLHNIRGTKRSYKILLRLIGFTEVNLIEDFQLNSFDSPLDFDSVERPTFDANRLCSNCRFYDLELATASGTVNDLQMLQLYDIVTFLEPINARLRRILLQGFDISQNRYIYFVFNNLGELTYVKLNDDLDVSFEYDSEGNLLAFGTDADKFELDILGNMKLDTFAL